MQRTKHAVKPNSHIEECVWTRQCCHISHTHKETSRLVSIEEITYQKWSALGFGRCLVLQAMVHSAIIAKLSRTANPAKWSSWRGYGRRGSTAYGQVMALLRLHIILEWISSLTEKPAHTTLKNTAYIYTHRANCTPKTLTESRTSQRNTTYKWCQHSLYGISFE